MTDAVQVAKQRRSDYRKSITTKESEIEELKELIQDLDSFIEFGEALVTDGKSQLKEVAPQPQAPVTPKAQSAEKDPAKEWETPSNQAGLKQVLASHGN